MPQDVRQDALAVIGDHDPDNVEAIRERAQLGRDVDLRLVRLPGHAFFALAVTLGPVPRTATLARLTTFGVILLDRILVDRDRCQRRRCQRRLVFN